MSLIEVNDDVGLFIESPSIHNRYVTQRWRGYRLWWESWAVFFPLDRWQDLELPLLELGSWRAAQKLDYVQ